MRLCSSSAKVEMRVAASSPSACCPASPHFGRESTRRAASSRCLAAVRATATSSMDTINIGASAVPTGTRALSIWAGGQHCHKCRRREGSSRSWTQGGHQVAQAAAHHRPAVHPRGLWSGACRLSHIDPPPCLPDLNQATSARARETSSVARASSTARRTTSTSRTTCLASCCRRRHLAPRAGLRRRSSPPRTSSVSSASLTRISFSRMTRLSPGTSAGPIRARRTPRLAAPEARHL